MASRVMFGPLLHNALSHTTGAKDKLGTTQRRELYGNIMVIQLSFPAQYLRQHQNYYCLHALSTAMKPEALGLASNNAC